MSCDEAVLQKANKDIREEYSTSLLEFSSKRTGLIYPLAFGENNAKSRVKNVLYFKKPAGWVVIVSILITVPFSVGFSFSSDLSAVGQKAIDNINAEEITSISVSAILPNQGVVIEDTVQINEVIELIKTLEIQKIYFPINNSSGQFVQCEINTESHKKIVIGIYGNHIVINGQWYIANDTFCKQISGLCTQLIVQ